MKDQTQKQSLEIPTHDALAAMNIEDALTRWPQTAVIFQQHNMACVGCAVANFYTIADAANVYGLPQAQFLAELMAAMGQP